MRWSRKQRRQHAVAVQQCRVQQVEVHCAVTPESMAAARDLETARMNEARKRLEKRGE